MLTAEQQFRRSIGDRDLATHVIALERYALPRFTQMRSLISLLPDRQAAIAVPPHDEPDILDKLGLG